MEENNLDSESIDPILLQLRIELNKLIKYFNSVKDKYKDVMYLAWISVEYGEPDWPLTGEFPKARKDSDFRNFRAAYRKCDELLEIGSGVISLDVSNGYRKRFLESNPKAPPF